jgi:hypothetical protein
MWQDAHELRRSRLLRRRRSLGVGELETCRLDHLVEVLLAHLVSLDAERVNAGHLSRDVLAGAFECEAGMPHHGAAELEQRFRSFLLLGPVEGVFEDGH